VARERPQSSCRAGHLDHDSFARLRGDIAKGMWQPAHADIENSAKIPGIGKRRRTNRHPNLLLVMPQLGELPSDVEPSL
jgi:hypothetical protein